MIIIWSTKCGCANALIAPSCLSTLAIRGRAGQRSLEIHRPGADWFATSARNLPLTP